MAAVGDNSHYRLDVVGGWVSFFVLYFYYVKDHNEKKTENNVENDNDNDRATERAFLLLCLVFQIITCFSTNPIAPLLSSVSAIVVFSYAVSKIRIPYLLALIVSMGLFVPRFRQLLDKNKTYNK